MEFRKNGTRLPEFSMLEALFADMPELIEQMLSTQDGRGKSPVPNT